MKDEMREKGRSSGRESRIVELTSHIGSLSHVESKDSGWLDAAKLGCAIVGVAVCASVHAALL